jgi:hypothetical protein
MEPELNPLFWRDYPDILMAVGYIAAVCAALIAVQVAWERIRRPRKPRTVPKPDVERSYCLGCGREMPSESGQVCDNCEGAPHASPN